LIEDVPQSGAFNMAADQVLLERFCPGDPPILRLYAWDRSTLSIGRNERLDSKLDPQRCAELGIPIVRRTTGGKAVLHGSDLTYAVVGGVLAPEFAGGVLDNYRFLAQGFFWFFKELGLCPELQANSRKSTEAHVCFADPSAYEILVAGRKLIGNAQRVRIVRSKDGSSGRVFLQHGSIPLADPSETLAMLFPHTSVETLQQQMHSLERLGVLKRHGLPELRTCLKDAISKSLDVSFQAQPWTPEERLAITEAERCFQPLGESFRHT
jgi:lipoate-protein ligase A